MTMIDLSLLDPPDLVETLDFEAAYQMKLAYFKRIYPDWSAALESDPVVKLIELAAYDEIRLRARLNDAARATMLAYATGADLEHVAALMGVEKALVDPGDPDATPADALANKLRAVAIVDGPNTDDEAAIAYARNFGSKRLYLVDPGVRYWDTGANVDADAPASAYAAGMFCQTDAAIGFWASPSNKEIVGITGTSRPIEFLDGDETCRANLLNNAFVTTIIRDGGFRLWGNRTLSADPKWSFVTRVRTLDIVMDAVQAGHKWAVDRGITATYVKDVTEGLQAFMRDLRTQGAIINFEVYADPRLNSASQLEQGKVYWNIRFTDVPPAENPIFRFEVTNQWLAEVLDTQS